MAVAGLHSMLQRNNDDGYLTCCIFLDLSKAFDTVNHDIPLNKLEKYGIRSNMHQLLCSYLNNRNHNTRSIANKNYYLQRMHSQSGQPVLNYVGVTIWNKIPFHVKLHSKHLFSKQL